jgi:hypothetical protein
LAAAAAAGIVSGCWAARVARRLDVRRARTARRRIDRY